MWGGLGWSAHHLTPWELGGVPVADNGNLLAVDRHVVVVNDPAAKDALHNSAMASAPRTRIHFPKPKLTSRPGECHDWQICAYRELSSKPRPNDRRVSIS